MSVNITVSVPLDIVASIKQGSDASKTADSIATITKLVVDCVKTLPYNITPATPAEETDNLSIKSFDSEEPYVAPPPAKKPKLSGKNEVSERRIGVILRTSWDKTLGYNVTKSTTAGQLKEYVARATHFSPKDINVYFDGSRLGNNDILGDVGAAHHRFILRVRRDRSAC